jgi:hypothetical protein
LGRTNPGHFPAGDALIDTFVYRYNVDGIGSTVGETGSDCTLNRKVSGARMKGIWSGFVIMGTVAVCGVFVYEHYPVAERIVIDSPEYRVVESTKPRKVLESIRIDGKTVEVGVVAYDTVRQPVRTAAVHETVTAVSRQEMLTYWAIVGILTIVGLYAATTYVLWLRDKWNRRDTKDAEDTKKRFDDLVKICMSVLLTLLGSAGLTGGLGKPLPPATAHVPDNMPAPALIPAPSGDPDPAVKSVIEPSADVAQKKRQEASP